MDIDIISEEENPMLHRRDVTFEIVHDEATPSRLSVRDSLAARLNKSADEVVIRELDTKFGMRRTIGTAKVYEGPEFARDVEQEYMLDRNKIGVDGNGEVETEPEADDEAEVEAESEVEAEPEPEPETETESEADADASTADEAEDEAEAQDEDETEDEA